MEQQGRARGRSRGKQQGATDAPSTPMQSTPHSRPISDPSQVVQPGPSGVQGLKEEPAEGVGRARGRSSRLREGDEGGRKGPQESRASYRGRERVGEGRPATVKRAAEAMGAMKLHESSEESDENGNGNGGNGGHSVGRGTMRGKRDISRIVWTKPSTVTVKKGTSGQMIPLCSNHFNIQRMEDMKTCLYHVYFSPEEDRTPVRKKLMSQHRNALGAYIFDGMKLCMSHKLPSDVTELVSKLEEADDAVFQLKLKFIKEVDFLDSEYIHIMNILMRRCMEHLGLQFLGRNYYNPNAEIRDERYKIAIWPGYTSTIRQHENTLLLGADVSHKFLRTETAYTVVLKRAANPKEAALKNLLGAIVVTKYNNKTYKIDDIAWDLNPLCKFPYKGKETSYMEYYQSKYQLRIKDVKQPLMLSKPKKKDLRRGAGDVYLIPELCIMTGLTEEMRSDFNMMKDLADYLRTAPDKRVHSLMRLNRNLLAHEKAKEEMTNWGLQMSNKLVELQGRVLPEEAILQSGKTVTYNRDSADWSREIRSLRLNAPISVQRWAIVFPARHKDSARELCTTLQRVGPPMGMQFANPQIHCLQSDSAQECMASLGRCTGMQLVLVVLNSNRIDYYSAVKRQLSITMGIPSQCVLSRTLFKKQRLMSVATKIAIQINCKLGGEPWSVNIPIKNTMVVGYDAYHEKGSRSGAYGAVVSSLNQSWSRYLSQAATHHNHEELSNNFALGVKNALQRYKQENGMLPSRILVYRDGVGEGQIEYVNDHEVAEIQKCFDLYETKPEFAFIIVSKKINTRFFSRSTGRIGNPPPGTVVDDVITLPERYDFFLVPQSTNVGTVSPTSFNIIADTTGLKPDHMQRLAFKLTHLYYNWQGTVRVPAPCMYAHKMAFMMGQIVNKAPHPNLSAALWYL
uniref:Piwi2 n=1 Tax=Eriocheir sinensis TaxID=95602 RepID=A0A6M8Q888_ERISI|nr:Piwi2 [Eriocheir sinensis]